MRSSTQHNLTEPQMKESEKEASRIARELEGDLEGEELSNL